MATKDPVIIAAAVIPAVLLVVRIYRADKLEKEPVKLILSLLVWGAVSTLLASLAEELGMFALEQFLTEDSFFYRLLFYGWVGLAEEGAKYILLKRRTWNSRDFNCQFDGVVYAVAVALGFALWENIGYIARFGLEIALVRALTAVPGHACFGVFMGAFYGMAKRYQQMADRENSEKCLRLAVTVPMVLHGCYDFIASSPSDYSVLVFLVFVIVLFVTASRMVRKLSREDRYIDARAIYGYRGMGDESFRHDTTIK